MRVGPDDLFTPVGHDYLETGIPVMLGKSAQMAYLALRRFVWRTDEHGHIRLKQLHRAGILAVRVSQRRLAALSGLSRSHLKVQLQFLEELGFVLRPGTPKGQSTVYILGYTEDHQEEGAIQTHEVFFADRFASLAWSALEKEGEKSYMLPCEMPIAKRVSIVENYVQVFRAEILQEAAENKALSTVEAIFGTPVQVANNRLPPGAPQSTPGSGLPQNRTTSSPVLDPGVPTEIEEVEEEKEEEKKSRTSEGAVAPARNTPGSDCGGHPRDRAGGIDQQGGERTTEQLEVDQGIPPAPSPPSPTYAYTEDDKDEVRGWRRGSKQKKQRKYKPIPAPPSNVDVPFAGSLLAAQEREKVLEVKEKAEARSRDAVEKRTEKRLERDRARSNAKGKPLPPGAGAVMDRLQEVWTEGMEARGERAGRPFRSKNVCGHFVELLTDFTVEELEVGMRFMLRYWEQVSTQRRWKGATPSIRLLMYFADEVVNDALKWGDAADAVKARESWLDDNPHDVEAPAELEKPYEEARKLGQQLGIM